MRPSWDKVKAVDSLYLLLIKLHLGDVVERNWDGKEIWAFVDRWVMGDGRR